MKNQVLVKSLIAALVLAAGLPALAGEDEWGDLYQESRDYAGGENHVTTVADAFDGDDPYDFNFTAGFDFAARSGLITQEFPNGGIYEEVAALDWNRSDVGFKINLEFGLYHDLALLVGLPIYQSQSNHVRLPANVKKDESTLLTQKRLPKAGEELTPAEENQVVPVIPGDDLRIKRGGFGDMTIGLAWQAMNEGRKPWLPSLTFAFIYTIPTGGIAQPTADAGEKDPGGVGRGVNLLTFGFAFSKRLMKYLDPYARIAYTLPVPTDKALIKPGHVGEFKMGTEVIFYEDVEKRNKFGLDLFAMTRYTGEADQEYTPVSDAIGHVAREEQFATIGGGFGLLGEISKWSRLALITTYTHDWDHYLTMTYFGEDFNGDGKIAPHSSEYNPDFDVYTEEPGRRLKLKNSFNFTLSFVVTAQF